MKTFKWTIPEFPLTERERNPPQKPRETGVSDTGKEKAKVAFRGIGAYSLIHILWFVWIFSGSGFLIFETIGFIVFVAPVLGLLFLIGYQLADRNHRFSIGVNLLALLVIAGWLVAAVSALAAASAAV